VEEKLTNRNINLLIFFICSLYSIALFMPAETVMGAVSRSVFNLYRIDSFLLLFLIVLSAVSAYTSKLRFVVFLLPIAGIYLAMTIEHNVEIIRTSGKILSRTLTAGAGVTMLYVLGVLTLCILGLLFYKLYSLESRREKIEKECQETYEGKIDEWNVRPKVDKLTYIDWGKKLILKVKNGFYFISEVSFLNFYYKHKKLYNLSLGVLVVAFLSFFLYEYIFEDKPFESEWIEGRPYDVLNVMNINRSNPCRFSDYKQSNQESSNYLVRCSNNGGAWMYYIVNTTNKKVVKFEYSGKDE